MHAPHDNENEADYHLVSPKGHHHTRGRSILKVSRYVHSHLMRFYPLPLHSLHYSCLMVQGTPLHRRFSRLPGASTMMPFATKVQCSPLLRTLLHSGAYSDRTHLGDLAQPLFPHVV